MSRAREVQVPEAVREGSIGQVLGSALSLLTAVGLVVVLPWALVVLVGWPLPSEVPTWDSFTAALEKQGVTAEVLVNALAVVVWLAWLPLTWAIVVEAIAAARGRVARRVVAWPGAQYVARRLVASATLLLSSVGAVRTAGAAPLDPLVVVGAEASTDLAAPGDPYGLDGGSVIDLGSLGPEDERGGDPGHEPGGGGTAGSGPSGTAPLQVGPGSSEAGKEPAMAGSGGGSGKAQADAGGGRAPLAPSGAAGRGVDDPGVPSHQAGAPEVIHEVEHGDTFWGLAEEYLGNGLRWREVRDHNIGRAVVAGRVLAAGEDHLQRGWRIVVPLDGLTAPEPRAAPRSLTGAGPVVADDAVEPTSTTDVVEPGGATEPKLVRQVEQGDSFWGLSEEYLGDGNRWREIRDHNVGRTVSPGRVLAAGEDQLEVGWTITLPPDAAGSGAAPATEAGTDAGTGTGGTAEPTPTEVTVQSGDHFWGIAERQLEQAWGRPVTADEVATYWQQLVAENLERVSSGGADLIYPGEQFIAPVPPPPPGESAPPAEERVEPPSSVDPDAASPPAEGGTPDEVRDEDAPVDDAEVAPPATEAPDDAEVAPPATAAPDDGLADDDLAEVEESLADAVDDEEAAEEDASSGIPLAVPLGASAALAGLLLVALGRRRFSRRRQLRPGHVVEPRDPDDAELERQFALGARDVLATVEAASRGYGAVLAGDPGLPPVTGLVVSPARDVVVHLAEPAVPEIPFERGPSSIQWELYLDELDLDPDFGPGPEPSASVLDTPAVIGRTDQGDWVLIDLESVGALEIEGDEEVASDLVRSIVAELSMAPQAERMVDITVVGVEGLSPDVLEQGVVSFDRLDEDLVRRVERVAAETDSLQPHRGAAARAQGMSRDGLFVMVVALGGSAAPDPVLLERLAAAATPGGRGIAVVAVGSLGAGATRVLVDENGDAHVPHMGLTVDAVQLAAESLQRVERLLADEPEVFPPPEQESVPEAWPEWPDEWSGELSREAPGGWMGTWLPANGYDPVTAAPPGSDDPSADPGMEEREHEAFRPPAEDVVPGAETESVQGGQDEPPSSADDVPVAKAAVPVAGPDAGPEAAASTEVDQAPDEPLADLPPSDDEPAEATPPAGAAAGPDQAGDESVAGDAGAADDAPADAVPAEAEAEPDMALSDVPGSPAASVDTIESDDLDDLAPNAVYDLAEGNEPVDVETPPSLSPVPPLSDVALPPVEAPEPPPVPEPLNLREEPQWPDPRGHASAAGPPDLPGAAGDQEAAGQWVPTYTPPPWELCVRIFADHIVETADAQRVSFRYGENPDVPNKNTHRGPELLAYLALCGRAATAEEVQDHMWWDRPIALSTVNKLVYGTRKVLGGADLLSHAQEDPLGRYRLAPTITTDAQLLAHALEHAQMVANRTPEAAIEVLRPHLAGIESVAFRNGHLGQGLMEWGAAYRVIDAVELPVIEAALLFSRLACEQGRAGYFDALWGVDQGLRACPYNEALVRVAMEIEAMLGNTDAVNHRYLSLATKLARDELEPEPETSDLRVRLGGTSRLRSAG